MVAVACTEDYSQHCSDLNIQHNAYGDGFLPNDSGMECPPGLFCNNRTCAHYHYPMTASSVMKKKALLLSWIATVNVT